MGQSSSRAGDAGFLGRSLIGSGALGLDGSGSSLDSLASMAGDTNSERPVSLKWLSMLQHSFSSTKRWKSTGAPVKVTGFCCNPEQE